MALKAVFPSHAASISATALVLGRTFEGGAAPGKKEKTRRKRPDQKGNLICLARTVTGKGGSGSLAGCIRG